MNSVIDRILNGQFENTERSLSFSLPRLELTIKPGEISEGSFIIYGPKDKAVQGLIATSELRMEVLTADFSGYEFEVGYRFDGTGLNILLIKRGIKMEYKLIKANDIENPDLEKLRDIILMNI